MRLTLAELGRATGGRVLGDPATAVDGASNDSRTLMPGQCFVAIVDQRDGHAFVVDAFARGAAAAIVTRVPDGLAADAALLLVDDPLDALSRAATHVRTERLSSACVTAVTGSSGKTSTKDLLASVLATERRVHANEASFNNEIGLPVTLLGAPDDVQHLVCEMGARFAGNITDLCSIAQPQIGVVTNIGIAHGEFLGGPDGVERAKGELLDALPPDGVAVLNADDAATQRLAARSAAAVLTAGRAATATVRIERVELADDLRPRLRLSSPWGSVDALVGLRGAHQAANAALAAAVALHDGVDPSHVGEGLRTARGSAGRMELARTVDGIAVLNDAYNANPASTRAALVALGDLPVEGRRVAVLGAMKELGAGSEEQHSVIGELAGRCGIDVLVAVGRDPEIATLAGAALSAGVAVIRVDDVAGALLALVDRGSGDAILVKASRAIGLEAIAEALLQPRAGVDA